MRQSFTVRRTLSISNLTTLNNIMLKRNSCVLCVSISNVGYSNKTHLYDFKSNWISHCSGLHILMVNGRYPVQISFEAFSFYFFLSYFCQAAMQIKFKIIWAHGHFSKNMFWFRLLRVGHLIFQNLCTLLCECGETESQHSAFLTQLQ